MHNATTKQRLAALRRKLGIFTGPPKWVRERRARLARLEAAVSTVSQALGFTRPAGVRAQETAATPALATATTAAAPPPPLDDASSRWVSESMFVSSAPDASQAVTQRVSTADIVRTHPEEEAPAGARGGPSRRAIAIAAACVAVLAAVLLVALRSPAPAPRTMELAPAAASRPVPLPAAAPVLAAPVEAAASPGPASVVVHPGDSLWKLAATHLGDPARWPLLHRANHDRIRNPDLIYPGQRIEVPR